MTGENCVTLRAAVCVVAIVKHRTPDIKVIRQPSDKAVTKNVNSC